MLLLYAFIVSACTLLPGRAIPAAVTAAVRASGRGPADCTCSCTTWEAEAWSAGTRGQGPRVSWDRSTMPGGGAAGAPLPGGLLGAAAGASSLGGPMSCSNWTCRQLVDQSNRVTQGLQLNIRLI